MKILIEGKKKSKNIKLKDRERGMGNEQEDGKSKVKMKGHKHCKGKQYLTLNRHSKETCEINPRTSPERRGWKGKDVARKNE